MTVNATGTSGAASAAGQPQSGLTGANNTIAGNFTTFLSLLTTQLKNQNPLDPLDTNQFTQQLVQFSSVEQQLKTNDYLKTLIQTSQNAQSNQAVSYIGKTVSAANAQSHLANGTASWNYTVPRSVDSATITVSDANGNAILSKQTSLSAGQGTFTWDGTGPNGRQYPNGNYSITVDARDGSGTYVPVTVQMSGKVTGVDLSGSEPKLNLADGSQLALSEVTGVAGT